MTGMKSFHFSSLPPFSRAQWKTLRIEKRKPNKNDLFITSNTSSILEKEYDMYRTIIALIILLISVSMFNATEAGTYPPAGSQTLQNIEYSTAIFPVFKVDVYLYDSLYGLERSADSQVVRGTVLLTYVENESNFTVRYDLYGSLTDTVGINPGTDVVETKHPERSQYHKSFNHVMVIIVPGSNSEAQVMIDHERGVGRSELLLAVDRILVIRIASQNRSDFESLFEITSPYIMVINQKVQLR